MDSVKYSIKCTNCAAPLSLRGGGHITTVTCGYCNSLLDLNDNYKVLATFKNLERPTTPFTLGMRGVVKGVEWIIIGVIVYRTDDPEEWCEFSLYSPLYGYAWLVYEEGKLSLSKRVRDFEIREWQEKSYPRTLFYRKGHYLASEESYTCDIGFVEGEMSWIAKTGDQIECWDYDGVKGRSLTVERNSNEYEVYLSEKLDNTAIYKSFGVDEGQQVFAKQSFHEKLIDDDALQTPASPLMKGMVLIFFVLLFGIIGSYYTDKTLYHEATSTTLKGDFTISSEAYVSQITLQTLTSKSLDGYEFTINDGAKKVFSIDKNSTMGETHYFKSSWDPQTNLVSIYLKIPKGNYQFWLHNKESNTSENSITLTIKEQYARLIYILPLFLVTLFFVGYLVIFGASSNRWGRYLLWSVGGILGVAMFGLGGMISIATIYFFIHLIIRKKKSIKEER